MFGQLKKEFTPDCPGIRVLCPTRWTVKEQSLKSIFTKLYCFIRTVGYFA